MISNRKILNFLSVTFALIILNGCTPSSPKLVPTITTTVISSITSSSAVSGGTITSDGGATISEQGVCWGTSSNPTISNSKVASIIGTSTFSATISGLTSNTTYYVRAYATNSEGTSYGNEVTFTTSQPTAPTTPTLTTAAASAIGATTIAIGGTISSDGGVAITARGICWSTTSGPTVALTTKTSDGTGSGAFNSNITGLSPLTTYYARAYATNSVGTVYGNEISFTTAAVSANTAGSLSVSFTTTSIGGQYSPANCVAIWVKNSSGAFVKSLLVYAGTRKSDLTNWVSGTAKNATDAVTGATQSKNAARSCNWNGTNISGTVVANGNYTLCMEITDGSRKYYEYPFSKGTSSATSNPANVTGFSSIAIQWTPN